MMRCKKPAVLLCCCSPGSAVCSFQGCTPTALGDRSAAGWGLRKASGNPTPGKVLGCRGGSFEGEMHLPDQLCRTLCGGPLLKYTDTHLLRIAVGCEDRTIKMLMVSLIGSRTRLYEARELVFPQLNSLGKAGLKITVVYLEAYSRSDQAMHRGSL